MGIRDGQGFLSLRYMGSLEAYQDAKAVIVGAPMDWTSSFRTGSRFGPQRIRESSIGLEMFSFHQEKSLEDRAYYDCGDLDLQIGNIQNSLDMIEETAKEVFKDNKFPVFLGGEHLISLPVIKQAYAKYGDELKIIHFDAHADLREDYLGERYSHASVIRRACEFVKPSNVYQIGIRSGERDEFEFAKNNTNFYPFEVVESVKKIVEEIGSKPVYVTMDVDVIDPAYADGTGTPEPGGCTSMEIFKAIMLMKDINAIGFDLVEVSPPYDLSGKTAILGAKIVREAIIAWGTQKER
ncbi:MAG: agmatinase [Deltaproteobacteria bacterium]